MKRFPKRLDTTPIPYKKDKRVYTPIHIHSSYSLFDSATPIKEISLVAKQLGMKAISLSDHGTMSGAFAFVQECKEKGIKPIVGCEFYVNPRRFNEERDTKNQHLCLFAMNLTGYKNMLEILYNALTEGFYYRGRTDLNYIAERAEGLICTTACISSPIILPYVNGKEKLAIKNLLKLKEAFGDRLYIEYQFNEMDVQKQVVDWLSKLCKRFDVKGVYGLDSHYTYPNDVYVQDILKLNQRKITLQDQRWSKSIFDVRRLFIKPYQVALDEPEELGFKVTKRKVQQLLEMTNEIADRVDFDFEFGLHAPEYKHKGKKVDAADFLKVLLERNFIKKVKQGFIPKKKSKEYHKRMVYEYGKILDCGYPNYFLIIWDMVKKSVARGIQRGIGRGSASGSLVSFVLDISGVDPIKHGLLFERFMDIERKDPPDIDLDWESERKSEIEDYLRDAYGKDKVAHVATFNYWGTKSSLSETFKILGESPKDVGALTRWIRSDELDNRDAKGIDGAIEFLKEHCTEQPVLEMIERQENLGIPLAKRLTNNVRHTGLHPGGVVISPKPIFKYIPVARHKDKIITGFSQGSDGRTELEDIGLIKIDNLGVNAVTVVKETLQLIKDRRGIDLFEDIWHLDLEESEVYKYYLTGLTDGVFQVESEKINRFIKKLKPNSFKDLCALVALFRPGGLTTGEAERFIKRKFGKEKITYVHPVLEKYMGMTYGCFVYQEQLMSIMHELAGFSKGEVLKCMKLLKKSYDMDDERVIKLVKRLREDLIRLSGFTEKQSDELTETMRKCYAYIFNKSHSTAYALFSYQMMWLKVHYPIEFICGLLSCTENKKTEHKGGEVKLKMKKYIDGAAKLGIEVLPPRFGFSGTQFHIVDDVTVCAGNRIVVGIGKSAEELEKTGEDSSFEDFVCNDKISWQKLNRSKVKKLIKVGFFDGTVKTRKTITRKQLVHAWNLYQERKKKTKDKRAEIKQAIKDAVDDVEGDYGRAEILEFQIEMFRFFFAEHPLESKDVLRIIWNYNQRQKKKAVKIRKVSVLNSSGVKRGTMVGYISNIKVTSPHRGPSKGQRMAILTVEDKDDRAKILVWPEYYEIPSYNKLLREGNVVVLRVKRKKEDGVDKSTTWELANINDKAQMISVKDLGRKIKRKRLKK